MRPSVEKFLSKRYDRLFAKASKLIKEYDPCRFEGSLCKLKRGRDYFYEANIYKYNGCCGKCSHLTKNGCSVQSLGCKLFLCETVRNENPILTRKINKITCAAHLFSMARVFMSKEELFNEFKHEHTFEYSLIFTICKAYYRPIRQFLWNQKIRLRDYYARFKYLVH